MNPITISGKRRIFEISAVILTATGKFIFMDYLNQRFAFVSIAIISWVVYIFNRQKEQPGILTYWGFRTDNFWKVAKMVLPFGIVSVIIFLVVGLFRGTIHITWHIIPILILYPVWGVIQQFLLIALTAGNLQDIEGQNFNKWIIILLAALLFAVVHYPFVWLMMATFVLAMFYGYIYGKERNIYVLGLFHGWLGAFFYYTILDRDPFLEMFGRLLELQE